MAADSRTVDGALVVEGLADFRRDLRKIDKRMGRALSMAHKKISTGRADEAKRAMKQSRYKQATKMGRHKGAADGVRPRGAQKSSSITMLGSNKGVRAMEFGTRYHQLFGRTVYANSMSRRVFPPWRGNKFDGGDWKDAIHGKSGYYVHPAIDRWIRSGGALDDLEEAYDWAFREAYPDKVGI